MIPAIRTNQLVKRYTRHGGLLDVFRGRGVQEVTAVDDLTLEVAPGEIFGLVGPNGAGKTTLIKVLCTLLLPSSGEASVCGHHVVEEGHRVRQLVALVTSEERSFFWRLTGRQNLQFFASLYHLSPRHAASRIDELFDLLDLSEVGDARFNEYSTGMRQKLAIARGLLIQPRILFMDEPSKGLDPLSAQALLRLIRERVAGFSGSTIIITTHILRDVEQLCDRVAIMNRGRLVACGSLEDLRVVSRQCERYRLKVRGLSEGSLRSLSEVRGVVNWAKVAQTNGLLEMEINVLRESRALSGVLQRMLAHGGDILGCTLEEERLEQVFSALVQGEATPGISGGGGAAC